MMVKAEKQLNSWLEHKKRVVIVGIGNPIRSDDYVGLKIAEGLKGTLPENVCLIEAETVPESYLLDIEEFKPTHVLLIDAAVQGLPTGEVSLVEVEKIVDYSAITTHLLPLKVFCEYIKQMTGAKIALLLVEPKSMEFGEGLTPEVQVAAGTIKKTLQKLLA